MAEYEHLCRGLPSSAVDSKVAALMIVHEFQICATCEGPTTLRQVCNSSQVCLERALNLNNHRSMSEEMSAALLTEANRLFWPVLSLSMQQRIACTCNV